MKLKELKHNHSLTDLLKVLIFSILMITPLLSVATRCLYVICNKNAYQSAEITQTTYNAVKRYQTNHLNSYEDFELNNYYVITWTTYYNEDLVTIPILEDTEIDNFKFISYKADNMTLYTINNNDIFMDYIKLTVNRNTTNQSIIEFDSIEDLGSDIVNHYNTTNYLLIQCVDLTNLNTIYSDFNLYLNDTNIDLFQEYNVTETQATTLDNVFEYSVNKLAESPILSWTQQTAIYTGVNTMTTQLGVSTPTIAMLIVYWFLLTVIYIIIDIIIKLFTWLTHMIGSKSV